MQGSQKGDSTCWRAIGPCVCCLYSDWRILKHTQLLPSCCTTSVLNVCSLKRSRYLVTALQALEKSTLGKVQF